MLELEDKDIKIVMTTVLYMFKKLNRDKEDIKKSQINILHMKAAISKTKTFHSMGLKAGLTLHKKILLN